MTTAPTLLFGPALRRGIPAVREALDGARETVLAERHAVGGRATARSLSGIVDSLVHAFLAAAGPAADPLAVLAVGGYGRAALCPHSDLDLVLIHDGPVAAVEEPAAALARLLWDVGFETNLTLRRLDEALAAMESDHTLASTFMDHRLVAGPRSLLEDWRESVIEPFRLAHGPRFVQEKIDEARGRHQAVGGGAGGLEPNVKLSPGALRDLHLLRWVEPWHSPPGGVAALLDAWDVMLRYRIELHLLAGRRQDVMDLGTQRDLVPRLPDPEGAEDDDPVRRHLRVLRPWFTATRRVERACRAVIAAPEAEAPDLPADPVALGRRLADPEPAGPLLRALDGRDRLADLVPGWGDIEALPQCDPYHAWTVSEHTLRAMEALDAAVAGTGPGGERLAAAAAVLPSLLEVRVALLLHDLGKRDGPAGHAERGARRMEGWPQRLGLDERTADEVLRLVRVHTVLGEQSATAVHSDAKPVDFVAAAGGDADGLRRLLLLTAADIGGVGHGAWNGWRATQVLDLFDRAAARFGVGLPAAAEDVAATAAQGLPPERQTEPAALLARAPHHYAATVDAVGLRRHLDLLRALRGTGRAAAGVIAREGATEFAVAAADRPALFADLAGVLTLHGLGIVAAEAFSLGDGEVVDVFVVAGEPGDATAVSEALVATATDAPVDIADRVRRFAARVPLRSRTVPDRRIEAARRDAGDGPAADLRVECPDRPGLLHDLARALSEAGAHLEQVRVATLGPRALDAFRVTVDGRPPDPGGATEDLLSALRRAAATDPAEGWLL